MNPLFSRMTARYTPPMNKEVMEGLAVSAMENLEEWLDRQIRSVCIGMPAGITYHKIERCTSQEDYTEITRERNSRRSFDLADSNIYLTRLLISFTDETGVVHDVSRYLQLPYVERDRKSVV
jgi:hypothetical protein